MVPCPIQRIIGVVENFGMPHFLFTLTSNETSNVTTLALGLRPRQRGYKVVG